MPIIAMVIAMVWTMVKAMVLGMGHIPYKNSLKRPVYRQDLQSVY